MPDWPVVASLGLLVAAVVMFIAAKRFGSRGAASSEQNVEPAQQSQDMKELVGQLDLLVKDVEETIDRRLAELDAAALRADEALARLELATERAQEASHVIQAETEAAGSPIWQPPEDPHAENKSPSADAKPAEDEHVTLIGNWPLPPKRPERQSHDAPDSEPARLQSRRHVEVAKLHDQGLGIIDIARKLQMDVGEVELILNLKSAQEPAQQ